MLIGDIPVRNAGLYPDKIGLIEGNTRLTYSQLNERVNRLGNAIQASGVKKGDRIAVLMHNCYQYAEFYFAAAKFGTPIVPLNYRYNLSEVLYVLQDSGAEILFFGKDYAPLVEGVRREMTPVKQFVCIDAAVPGMKNYEEMISSASDVEPVLQLDEDDLAILSYTGGTTGKSKGVMTTHRNIITSCYNTALVRHWSDHDVFLCVPPVFHAGCANSMFAVFFIGATNVILNSASLDVIFKTIEECKVTVFLFVPTMVITLAEHPNIGKYDLSSLKTIYYGTAPMPVATLKRAMQVLKCNFSQTYGLTETYVPVSILKPEDHILDGSPEEMQRLYSAGREVPGIQVRIVDDEGREVKTGDIGEITVKGANVMKGYWNQPELTKETLKDGWLYTGDMGRMDRLRYLYVVDRKKDMIISGGENIYAKEVEDVLVTHPAVAQAVVIGVPDDKWGESVKALIVKRKDVDATEEEIINFCKDRLASFKKPKSIEFVEDFPKSTAGKILKRELRQEYWAGRDRKI